MFKLFFGLFIIGVALYLCVELIPPYYSNYEFQDALNSEALQATNGAQTEDAIRDTVFKKAQELSIPVTKEGIMVHRVGVQGSGSVSIDVPYTVHLDLLVHPTDLHFDATVINKGAF
jgi:hypothetical protein